MLLLALGMFLGALAFWAVPRLDYMLVQWRVRRPVRGEEMEWEAPLNAGVRDRNVMGVKDPLMDLLVAMCMELVRLEAATAYARPQWETLGPDATTPVETLRENQREALKEINA